MSEQHARSFDHTIQEWLRDDAQEAAKAYHGMDVPRGEAYDCTLLCIGTRLGIYGCEQSDHTLEFVRDEVRKAIAAWYGEQVRS